MGRLDLEEIYTVLRERSSESNARLWASAWRENLAGGGREPSDSFFFWNQEDEAREILGIVLMLSARISFVVFAPRRRRLRRWIVSTGKRFAHAAGVSSRHAFPIGDARQRSVRIVPNHGMRSDGADVLEREPGAR